MSNTNYIGFVYMWTNTQNNKKYIGSHCGKIDDGYIGSGKYFIKAFKKTPQFFTRTILEYFYNKNEQFIVEQKYLDNIENIIENNEYYNLTNKAGGGDTWSNLSPIMQQEITNTLKEKRNNWWLSLSKDEKNDLFSQQQETRNNKTIEEKERIINKMKEKMKNKSEKEKEEIANKKRESWKTSPKRNKHSENTRKRRLQEEENMTDEDKIKRRNKCKELYNNRDKTELENIRKTVSIKTKDFWNNPENKEKNEKRIQKMKETRNNKKLKCITKDHANKQVPEKELQNWLSQGWRLGMFKKPRS